MHRGTTLGLAFMMALGLGVGSTLAGCATSSSGVARVAGGPSDASTAAFARLKTLEGQWYSKDDKGQESLASVIKVSSAGSAVVETMFPGEPHEMTNVYTLDGDRVLATHYCAQGNQPRMACTGIARDGSIPFAFESVTNLASSEQTYMGGLTLRQSGNNQLTQEWTSYTNGVADAEHHAVFELTRK